MWLSFLALASCVSTPGDGENVLVVVLDDVGVDKLQFYDEPDARAVTPTLDSLARESIVFRHAYAYPTCSPGRAAMLTGRHTRRYGLGRYLDVDGGSDYPALPLEEVLLPEYLQEAPVPWHTSYVGKWHLTEDVGRRAQQNPRDQGFDWFAGTLANLGGESGGDYFSWRKTDRRGQRMVSTYATTDTIDDAIDRMRRMPSPWLLVVSPNAPHRPLHEPSAALVNTPLGASPSGPDLFDAMLEALDTELGRLIASMNASVRARTTIIVASENGTPQGALRPPARMERHKDTAFEAGVRVPFMVLGPHVADPGTRSDALVHVVDIVPTVLELAGVPAPSVPLDGHSMLPLLEGTGDSWSRTHLFAEAFTPNGPGPYDRLDSTIRDHDFKLKVTDGSRELYRLGDQLDEGPDLLAGVGEAGLLGDEQVALAELQQAFDEQLSRFELD